MPVLSLSERNTEVPIRSTIDLRTPKAAPSEPERARRSFTRVQKLVLGSVLVAVTVLHVVTIKPGHGWHDDYASYIAHAQNIVEGQPYADTGYVYNPERAVVGPTAYPPLYPVMLAPVVRAAGMNLWAMKFQLVVFLVGWLMLVAALLRRRFSARASIAVVAALGSAPFTIELTNNVLSDLPFAMLMTAATLVLERSLDRPHVHRVEAAGAGVLVYLVYATRSIGAVMIPAMWLFVLLCRRGRTTTAWIATGVFAALAGAQTLILDAGSDYAAQLADASPRLAAVNLWRYMRSLDGLTSNPWAPALGHVLFLAFVALAAAGYLRRLRRVSIVEVIVPVYLVTIGIWPAFQDLRFLVPILPFIVFYAAEAGIAAARRTIPRAALVAALAAVAVSYAGIARAALSLPAIEGPTSAHSQAMFDFAAERSAPDDLFVFQRPKAFALYSGRSAVAYPGTWDDATMRSFIERMGVDFLADADFDDGYLTGYAARHPDEVRLVFAAGEHHLWRVRR